MTMMNSLKPSVTAMNDRPFLIIVLLPSGASWRLAGMPSLSLSPPFLFFWLHGTLGRHPDPRKRPNFEDINNFLDIILIHAAIIDEQVHILRLPQNGAGTLTRTTH